MNYMLFNLAEAKQLQKAYNDAVAQGQEQFIFRGEDLLVAYAKYLLEYLKTRFPKDLL